MGSSASVINKKINESNSLIQNPLKKEDNTDKTQINKKEHIVVSSYGNKFNYNDTFERYQHR